MSLSLWNDVFFADPFSDLKRLQRDLDRMFLQTAAKEESNFFRPSVDLRETEKDLVLHAELPGIKKEDIHIDLKDGILTVSGEKKQEKKEENEKWHRVERSYGKFSRSLAVPKDLKEDQIRASFNDGVLEVAFPKSVEVPKPEPKRIAIQ